MRWRPGAGRGQVEDLRGRGGVGGIPLPIGAGGGLGLVGLIVYLLVNALGGGGGFDIPQLDPYAPAAPPPRAGNAPDPDAKQVEFVRFVVGHVQQTWAAEFDRSGQAYEPTQLVLFSRGTNTGCGAASSATGPFYCPVDRRVYLDLSFFRELAQRFGAPGDFAQAYVIAHEFGHHVQNITGIFESVSREQQSNADAANELSIRLELQADCLAGVWGFGAQQQNLLEPGDVEEGLAAAAAVGDDRIQRQAPGRVDQESWTHGSSAQRVNWFRRGFENGDPGACDTFSGDL